MIQYLCDSCGKVANECYTYKFDAAMLKQSTDKQVSMNLCAECRVRLTDYIVDFFKFIRDKKYYNVLLS